MLPLPHRRHRDAVAVPVERGPGAAGELAAELVQVVADDRDLEGVLALT
jgi:hypothetical protein